MPEVAPAMAAYLGVRRQREKASSVTMRRLLSICIANQDSAVVQAMAMDAAASQCGERRWCHGRLANGVVLLLQVT